VEIKPMASLPMSSVQGDGFRSTIGTSSGKISGTDPETEPSNPYKEQFNGTYDPE
jgi:hypothetical protein